MRIRKSGCRFCPTLTRWTQTPVPNQNLTSTEKLSLSFYPTRSASSLISYPVQRVAVGPFCSSVERFRNISCVESVHQHRGFVVRVGVKTDEPVQFVQILVGGVFWEIASSNPARLYSINRIDEFGREHIDFGQRGRKDGY